MVVEHAYIKVSPGSGAAFEAAYAAAEHVLTGAAGCRAAALFRDAEHPDSYLLQVSWERLEDHLEIFPSSRAGQDFAAAVASFFDGRPEVRHHAAEPVGGQVACGQARRSVVEGVSPNRSQ